MTSTATTIDTTGTIEFELRALADEAERALARSLASFADDDGARPSPRLAAAMRYATLGGGKRLRPALVVESACAAARLPRSEIAPLCEPALIAVEYVHTYSLIHDDLPAMDDDELRRGRPTVHVAFDEATAILAGDALLTDAFAVLSGAPLRAAEQVRELALAAGSVGMVSGQADDIGSVGAAASSIDVDVIARKKTGRLITACCVLGGLSVNAPADVVSVLRDYGVHVGLAFQIADDLLDALGDEALAGKHLRRDAQRDKPSFVSRYGVEGARERGFAAAEAAIAAARRLEAGAALVDLAWHVVHRVR